MTTLFPPNSVDDDEHLLPPFQTLLLKGEYHPSAPLHLCLSALRSTTTSSNNDDDTITSDERDGALLLTPSRDAFSKTLQAFKDGWIEEDAMKGKNAALLARVKIL